MPRAVRAAYGGKVLYVEFEGLVDSDKAFFEEFCPAIWKTYNLSSWDQAYDHCNQTGSMSTYKVYSKGHNQVIGINMLVYVRVQDIDSMKPTFTDNLRYTKFLTSAESVKYVSDRLLGQVLVSGLTAMVAASVIVLIFTLYYLS